MYVGEYRTQLLEIRLYKHDFVTVGSYNSVKLRVTGSYKRPKKSRLFMVVTYYQVKVSILQIVSLKWSKELVRLAVNSWVALKLAPSYRSLVTYYGNTILLNDFPNKLVRRWVSYTIIWNRIIQIWLRYDWFVYSCKIESHCLIQTSKEVTFIYGCYVLPCTRMYSSNRILKLVLPSSRYMLRKNDVFDWLRT